MARRTYFEEAYRMRIFAIEKKGNYAEVEARWTEYNGSNGKDIVGLEWKIVTPSTDEYGNIISSDWVTDDYVMEIVQNYDD